MRQLTYAIVLMTCPPWRDRAAGAAAAGQPDHRPVCRARQLLPGLGLDHRLVTDPNLTDAGNADLPAE